MRSYHVKENHFGSVVIKIHRYRQTDKKTTDNLSKIVMLSSLICMKKYFFSRGECKLLVYMPTYLLNIVLDYLKYLFFDSMPLQS